MVNAGDLLDPKGDVDASMFPDDDTAGLTARLAQYVTRAAALVAASTLTNAAQIDAAVALYAYHLAFQSVYNRLSAQPLSMSLVDAGARARSQQQIEHFGIKAADYLERFNNLVPPLVSPATPVQSVVTSTRLRPTW